MFDFDSLNSINISSFSEVKLLFESNLDALSFFHESSKMNGISGTVLTRSQRARTSI